QVKAVDRRPRGQPPVPHLARQRLALEDVTAGEPYATLDVRRAKELEVLDALADVRRVDGDRVENQLRDPVPVSVPVAVGELVGSVVGEDAHHVSPRRRDGVVVGRLEVELGETDSRLASLTRLECLLTGVETG